MILFDILAWIATVLGIVMYAPQTFKTVKTKNINGLSKTTFTIVAFGSAFFAIYTIDVRSYQAWVMNIVLILLMIPIINLLFPRRFFILISIALLTLFLISLLILILNIHLNQVLQYIFVILASISRAISFLSQIFKTFKYKNASSLSILSLVVVLISLLFWTSYWLGRIVLEGNQSTFIIAFLSASSSSLCQLPLIYAFFKFKDNKKSNKRRKKFLTAI